MLVTRCPHCQTRFRVTPSQLELREGMVRCGACRELFNGHEQLESSADQSTGHSTVYTEVTETTTTEDINGRMTLVDFGSLRAAKPSPPSTMQHELDALSKAITDLQSKPWETTQEAELTSEPPPMVATTPTPLFVEEARKREQSANSWKWLLWLGIPFLFIALLLQLGYFFRADIAARSPEAGRYLRAICTRVGCQVRLPEHIDLISLESSQLQPVSDHPGQFVLTALIRNQANTVQAWPSIELQLKTDVGQILVRKVFSPINYLNPNEVKKGIAARAEQEIQINFELSGEFPGGFSTSLFYQ
ncbi:MAG: zinc-ribbon and DUF3426 domain-containing protein [bacterium]